MTFKQPKEGYSFPCSAVQIEATKKTKMNVMEAENWTAGDRKEKTKQEILLKPAKEREKEKGIRR